ncbi:MAG: HU family DNA-binding protein [Pseudomonadota bacterium]
MTKSELIILLSKKYPDFYQRDIEKIVNAILAEIVNSLKTGGRVELRGFGAFSVRKREARLARNPKNGTEVKIGERHAIYFRTGKDLREKINK